MLCLVHPIQSPLPTTTPPPISLSHHTTELCPHDIRGSEWKHAVIKHQLSVYIISQSNIPKSVYLISPKFCQSVDMCISK